MSAPTISPPAADAPVPDDAPLTGRELAVVVAVWLAWALLSVANRVLNPLGPGGQGPAVGGALAVAGAEALCWIALTPLVLRLAARFGTDRTPPLLRVLVLGTAGALVALALGYAGGELRRAFETRMDGPTLGPGSRPPGGPPGGLVGTPLGPPAGVRLGRRPRFPWFGFLNALILYLTVVAVGLARVYARRAQARREQAARLEAQLAEARLDALRRQLDPHFLFNTLNAVSSLVERDPRGVRRMIARLSELLRHSFEGGAPEVPLRDELALLGRYVDIMQVRFQGRLAVETRADPAALDALVPTLILQPLVENAIKHGVERQAGPGQVTVEAAAERDSGGGETLVLRVRDNGPGPAAGGVPDGIPPNEEVPNGTLPNAERRGGVGLRNTVARLEQLYGPAQRFALGPGPDGGAVAEVRLPLRRAAAAPAGGRGVFGAAALALLGWTTHAG